LFFFAYSQNCGEESLSKYCNIIIEIVELAPRLIHPSIHPSFLCNLPPTQLTCGYKVPHIRNGLNLAKQAKRSSL
jgi:hypothetical protein